jgi:hypothetical protein
MNRLPHLVQLIKETKRVGFIYFAPFAMSLHLLLRKISDVMVTLNLSDRWRYKTLPSATLCSSAPYINSVFSTLEEVIDYFNKGGRGGWTRCSY